MRLLMQMVLIVFRQKLTRRRREKGQGDQEGRQVSWGASAVPQAKEDWHQKKKAAGRELGRLSQVLRACPYHNVPPAAAFPLLLLTCSQGDARVPAWSPLKYLARLRSSSASAQLWRRCLGPPGRGD